MATSCWRGWREILYELYSMDFYLPWSLTNEIFNNANMNKANASWSNANAFAPLTFQDFFCVSFSASKNQVLR